MPAVSSQLANRQHVVLALLAAWLIITSPWVSLLRRIPGNAGFFDYSHIILGFACLLVTVTYLVACSRRGGWRLYFPWLAGQLGSAARDVRGLLRGQVPAAEGGGLFALIEGLTLLALLATGLTGAAWFALQGSGDALDWRAHHILAARIMIGLLVAHVISVAMHLVELVRN
jgi:uncharacterized protein YggT (Ycf19 family)